MRYDPAELSVRSIYLKMVRLITPRPIAWVSTISPAGTPNLAPFSFFNGVGANPPSIMFAPVNRRDGTHKDTLINVEATGQFVVNIATFDIRTPMNQSSADYDYETNEFSECGLTEAESDFVKPPRVAEAKAAMECELLQTLHLGAGPAGANMVIGRIVMIHVADDVLDADQEIDPAKLDTIGRLGGADYCRTIDRFEIPRP